MDVVGFWALLNTLDVDGTKKKLVARFQIKSSKETKAPQLAGARWVKYRKEIELTL